MDASYDKTCQCCCCARNQVGNSQEWVTSTTPHHGWKNHMLPPLETGNREIWEKDVKISLTKCTLNVPKAFQGIKSFKACICCQNSNSLMMFLLFWIQKPSWSWGGGRQLVVRNPVILDTVFVCMWKYFLFQNTVNFRFIICRTATALTCYESSVENEPFGKLIMILHIVSERVSAQLYLVCCSQTVIWVYLSSLPWKLSE